jgi:hypothetical protein
LDQIIFLGGFAGQGVLNKDPRVFSILRWTNPKSTIEKFMTEKEFVILGVLKS